MASAHERRRSARSDSAEEALQRATRNRGEEREPLIDSTRLDQSRCACIRSVLASVCQTACSWIGCKGRRSLHCCDDHSTQTLRASRLLPLASPTRPTDTHQTVVATTRNTTHHLAHIHKDRKWSCKQHMAHTGQCRHPIPTTTSARCAGRSSHITRRWRTAHSVGRASIRKELWRRFADGKLTATRRISTSHFTPRTTRIGTAVAAAAVVLTPMVRPTRMHGWSSNNRSKRPGGTVPTLAAAVAAARPGAAVGARWTSGCSCTTTMRSDRG